MFVVYRDECARIAETDAAQPRGPVQYQPTDMIIGNTAQAVTGDALNPEPLQQRPRPVGVVGQPPMHVVLQGFAAGRDHEAPIVPHLQELNPFALTAIAA